MIRIGFLLAGRFDSERAARCRELQALSLVYLGLRHPATVALGAAAADLALAEFDAIPALRRRRLLASYGALLSRKPIQDPIGKAKVA